MNQEQKEQIRAKMFERMKARGITSYVKLANDIGISNALITYIEQTQFGKISDKMWQKIAAWCGYFDQRKPAQTTAFKRITNACNHVQTKGLCRGISFNSGAGKSFPLKHYKNNNENVFYVECNGFMTKKDFLRAVMQECKLEENSPCSIGDMLKEIFAYLNTITKPLLIIDEADELKDKLPTFLKTFYNHCNTGIFVSGGNTLRKQFEKGAKLVKQSYQEGFSRMGGEFVRIDTVSADDITLICLANGVSEKQAITKIIGNCNGDLRRVDALMEEYHAMIVKGGIAA